MNTKGKTTRSSPRPTIGLIIDNVSGLGEYQSIVWAGVANAARARDVNLICFVGGTLKLSPVNEFESQRNIVYDLVTPNNVDGVILVGSTLGNFTTPQEVRAFYDRYSALPRVSVGLRMEGIPSVVADNETGLRQAIAHLIEHHGRRRIAFIRGPMVNDEAEQRYKVYAETLQEHGLPLDPALVANGNFLRDSGIAAISLLLDREGVSFDAVVAANDLMALGAMQALQAHGKRVPQDIAVIGFDNLEETRASMPTLTTVRQPTHELGKRAVDLLLDLLAGKQVPEQTLLPTDVVVRQSCGCFYQTILRPISAQVPPGPAKDQPLDVILASVRPTVVAEMTRAVGRSYADPQNIAERSVQLFDAFATDLSSGAASDAFLQTLNQILQQAAEWEDDVTEWHRALSALHHYTLPCLTEPAILSRAVDILHRAWILIGEAGNRAETNKRLRANEQADTLRDISQALITALDLPVLWNTITHELPRLNIERCFLSLYEDPSDRAYSTLALAYDENGPIELDEEKRRFPTRQLAPEGLLTRKERFHLLVDALHFREEHFGFVLFEVGLLEGIIYPTLRAQISGALKGALLFRERQRTAEELARSNKELEQFAYVASHDLQEPLRMVRSYLQLLERRYKGLLDQEADEFISFAVDGAARMQRLIGDLLAYSRVGTHGKPLAPTNCNQALKSALSNLKLAIEDSNAQITADPLPTVMGDEIELTQLFQNLISNAIKFRRKDSRPEIYVGATLSERQWVFRVQDNGIGVPPEHFDRIFMVFQRLHSRDEYEGSGIGLAVCKKIVERHGGRIWLESEPGRGTTFYFTIPEAPRRL